MTGAQRTWKVLIPAVGGQGGGILMDWLIRAAVDAGLIATGVALPGLSQRGGGTSYYVEVRDGDSAPGQLPRAPGLFPVPGDIDIIVAQEFLELGRALEGGFATPDRTLVIGSTHRFLGTLEKLPGGPGIYPSASIAEAAAALARQFVLLDLPALLQSGGLEGRAANAVLAGALAASGALPIPTYCWPQAIRSAGVAVEANLAAFTAGLECGLGHRLDGVADIRPPDPPTAPGVLADQRAAALGRRGPAYRRVWERIGREFPAAMQAELGEAAYLLTGYHGAAYAGEYLDRIAPFAAVEERLLTGQGLPAAGFLLSGTMARHLCRWMMYEDAVRVADLKTRPQRFRRMLDHCGAQRGEVLRVVDYLAPEPWDLYTLLPYRLVRAFTGRREDEDAPAGRHWPLRWATGSLTGYLALRLLAGLRPLRRVSYRMAWERVRLTHFCSRVLAVAEADYALGVIAARSGDLVRGYGAVRRRGLAALRQFLDQVAAPPPAGATPAEREETRRRAQEFLQQATALTAPRGRQSA